MEDFGEGFTPNEQSAKVKFQPGEMLSRASRRAAYWQAASVTPLLIRRRPTNPAPAARSTGLRRLRRRIGLVRPQLSLGARWHP